MRKRLGPRSRCSWVGNLAVLCWYSCAGLVLAAVACSQMGLSRDPIPPPNEAVATKVSLPQLVFTQVPVGVDAKILDSRSALGDGLALLPGSRIVSYDPSASEQKVWNLTGEFSAAGSPDVSFDGQRILFVARRSATDPFDVWEMNIDGSGLRQITKRVGSCCGAIYLSTIYTIDAEELVHQIAFCSDVGDGAEHSLYTCRMDGTRVRRITFNPYGATDPCLLSDGRLLYCSGRPPESALSSVRGHALFTVNTDGTDVFVFAGAHETLAIRGMPCETPDGRVIYVESVRDGWDRGGSLVSVSRTASLHTRRLVAGNRSDLYRSPSATADGNLLVSYRRRGSGSWGIYVLDPRSGVRTAAVYDAQQWHEIDAVSVRARAEPAGRSSVVDERVETGLLYCLDAYLSDTAQPQRIGNGQIKWLQIFSAVTDDERKAEDPPGKELVEPGSGVIAEELIGTVEVESDGSFHLKIPARRPLRLQTLDSGGQVIQAMRNWIWVMPNEARGCIGCHEDRELSPPNRHALALRKPPSPVGVGGSELDRSRSAREHRAGERK